MTFGIRKSLAGAFCLTALCLTGLAHAQTVYLQDSTIVGSGTVLTATRVPVVVNGKGIYEDVTITLTVGSNGELTYATPSPAVIASPTLTTAHFVAGEYLGAGNVANNLIAVSGPGALSAGNTVWSLATAPKGAQGGGTVLVSAMWYVGSIASNPLASRILKAGIKSTDYSYGISGMGNVSDFTSGALLGFSQTGNALTVVSFTDGGGTDHATPQTQYTYTFTPG